MGWKAHLNQTEPLLHFIESVADIKPIEAAARALGFSYFVVPGSRMSSDRILFDTFAKSCLFFSYFGRNWSALTDCLRDLPVAGNGSVLVLENSEALTLMGKGSLTNLLEIAHDLTSEWKAGYGQLSPSKPFHWIFRGQESARADFEKILKQQLCAHLQKFR